MINMRDYPPAAKAVWIGFALAGAAIIVGSAISAAALPRDLLLQCAVGTVCAVVASFFPIKQPGTTDAFSASDLFLFLILPIAGPGAAVTATAIESFAAAYRVSRRWTSRLGTPAFCALGMALAGLVQGHVQPTLQAAGFGEAEALLTALLAAATVYFFVHSFIIDTVFRLKANKPLALGEWLKNSYWHWCMLCVAALLAGLLFLTVERLGIAALLVGAPVVLLASSSLHYYFGTVEAHVMQLKTSQDHLKQLAASEEKFHKAFDKTAIGLALIDEELNIIQANEAFAAVTGELLTKGIVRSVRQYLPVDSWRQFDADYAQWREDPTKPFNKEMRIACVQPRECWVHATLSVFETDEQGRHSLILQINDVTARRRSENQLEFLAYHDPLTGLKNRAYLHEVLQEALNRGSRDANFKFALVMMDFDRFKLINDTLGHAAGDEMLVKIAERLKHSVRGDDTVARFGGDEFAILLYNPGTEADTIEFTERVMRSLAEPMNIAGLETSSSASFGITFNRFGYLRPDDMLRDADLAMYEAKRTGRSRAVVFSGVMHERASQSLRIETELRHGIRNGALRLALQPIWGFGQNRAIGVEALVRWQHPTRGLLSPGEFMTVAEETGLVTELGDWVIDESFAYLKDQMAMVPNAPQPLMSINVSPRQFSTGVFAQKLVAKAREFGVPPGQIVVELTEEAFSGNRHLVETQLHQLRDAGFEVALDDFGTGYSSLSQLQRIPATIIKLDRSFTQRLTGSSRDREIATAIVGLAHSLGMSVCAEGVETQEVFEAVRKLGCKAAQGYYVGKPQLIDKNLTFLNQADTALISIMHQAPVVPTGRSDGAKARDRAAALTPRS